MNNICSGVGSAGRDEEPPGPDTLPFVGAVIPALRRPFEYRRTLAREYGDVVGISALGRRVYLVSHPDDVRRVLVTDADRYRKPSFEKRFLSRAFGDSLPVADGETWRRGRQVAQPVFTMERIERYGATMTDVVEDIVREWDNGETIEITQEMRRLTFQVLARTLFDFDQDRIPDLRDDFQAVATKLRPKHALVPDWVPTRTNREYKRALSRLETEIDARIARRRNSTDRGDDLLSLLLGANQSEDVALSDERIRDELLSFFFAGHETTAMAFTFAWYLLGTHPSVRHRLESEVDNVLEGASPGVTDLAECTYLEWVISETLRLYPPNHLIPREPVTDVTLGGYRIPAGSSVYCSQWIVHRDERWFDDPTAFEPERWAGDDPRPEYAYFPFGGGPRHCIGMRFARLELRLGIASIAQRVSLDRSESEQTPPTLAAGLSTHPTEPIELAVSRRR